ncbi:MAG: RNA-binding protein [Pseudomonadota bacterium]
MPTGPQGQKRPADSIGCAVMVGMIATGGVDDTTKPRSGRVKSGRAGAKARADSLTKERRSEIAKKAAERRWKNED